jgi:hypothetical protein
MQHNKKGETIMFKKIALISTLVTILMLSTACTSYQAEQAPCNQFATGCGTKIKINLW